MTEEQDFEKFKSIPRYNREVCITEKIDGTNAQVFVYEEGDHRRCRAGSRNRWITPDDDNYGFAKWVADNEEELTHLGIGRHYGEWWGSGIQRRYGLEEKRFSLFNTHLWSDEKDNRPGCCHVVPVLRYAKLGEAELVADVLNELQEQGSWAAPGFDNPEGVVIYHMASGQYFKQTLGKEEQGGKS